jgi:hypothetical protein
MPLKTKKLRLLLIVAGVIVAGVVTWSFLGYPTSLDEAFFLHRLSSNISAGSQELRLSELMPGDWELVCESHSYDGPLYLKRYEKIYPPSAPPQDGVWGFVFISKDGSYRSTVGSCGSTGAHISLHPLGCIERQMAVLVRDGKDYRSCPVYKVGHS